MLAFNHEKRHNRIITPHPDEAARLLNGNVGDIKSDRLLAVHKLVRRYGGVVVLKGADTLLAAEDGAVADVGNAGMVSGRMGMYCPVSSAVCSRKSCRCMMQPAPAAWFHGATADRLAAKKGTRGMFSHRFTDGVVPIC